MKSLPIKTWLVGIFLPLAFIVPLFLGIITAFFLEKDRSNHVALLNQKAEENWKYLSENIFNQAENWENEEWQKKVIPELQKRKIYIRIIKNDNKLVFYYPITTGSPHSFHEYSTDHGIIYLSENYTREIPPTRIAEMKGVLESFLHMNQVLNQAHQKQKKLEEERKMFVSSIAHDLRTPLFSIRGALQAIEKGIHPERNKRYIEICINKSDHLSKMIDELFLFAKLDQVGYAFNRESVDLYQLIQEILDDFQWNAQSKNIQFKFTYHSSVYLIEGDKDLLHRAFSNILLNALQYTPKDGDITVSVNENAEHLQIMISDSGPGIRKEDLPYIFLPFYRADHARNAQKQGSGLGLAIAERIFSAHNGKISVSSTAENKGTTFLIQLPKP